MFHRFLQLAILALTTSSVLSQGDFDWDITPEDGFPIISFDDVTNENEVQFKYNFTGTLGPQKFLDVALYQSDCETPGDASLAFLDSINGDELDIDIDIIQASITQSDFYNTVNITSAAIGFCLRVDYNFIDNDGNTESVNFYETNVTITVDLTAGFELIQITTDRTDADQEAANADLDYPVEAYICTDDDVEVPQVDIQPLVQGSALQVCVRIDDTVVNENILVEDILTFTVTQPGSIASPSNSIANTVADPLTAKLCRETGICNVKTQLQSKFFSDPNPLDLRVDGIAILAFGTAVSGNESSSSDSENGIRRLRAPIRGLLSAEDIGGFLKSQNDESSTTTHQDDLRKLQEKGVESEFDLKVGLQGTPVEEDTSSSGGSDMILIAVVVLIVLAIAGCLLFFFFTKKNRRNEKEEEIVRHHNMFNQRHHQGNSGYRSNNYNDRQGQSLPPPSVYSTAQFSGSHHIEQHVD